MCQCAYWHHIWCYDDDDFFITHHYYYRYFLLQVLYQVRGTHLLPGIISIRVALSSFEYGKTIIEIIFVPMVVSW